MEQLGLRYLELSMLGIGLEVTSYFISLLQPYSIKRGSSTQIVISAVCLFECTISSSSYVNVGAPQHLSSI